MSDFSKEELEVWRMLDVGDYGGTINLLFRSGLEPIVSALEKDEEPSEEIIDFTIKTLRTTSHYFDIRYGPEYMSLDRLSELSEFYPDSEHIMLVVGVLQDSFVDDYCIKSLELADLLNQYKQEGLVEKEEILKFLRERWRTAYEEFDQASRLLQTTRFHEYRDTNPQDRIYFKHLPAPKEAQEQLGEYLQDSIANKGWVKIESPEELANAINDNKLVAYVRPKQGLLRIYHGNSLDNTSQVLETGVEGGYNLPLVAEWDFVTQAFVMLVTGVPRSTRANHVIELNPEKSLYGVEECYLIPESETVELIIKDFQIR